MARGQFHGKYDRVQAAIPSVIAKYGLPLLSQRTVGDSVLLVFRTRAQGAKRVNGKWVPMADATVSVSVGPNWIDGATIWEKI